jgi:hypothetical protein
MHFSDARKLGAAQGEIEVMAKAIKSASQTTGEAEPGAPLTDPDNQEVIEPSDADDGPDEPVVEADDSSVAEPPPPVEQKAERMPKKVSVHAESPKPAPAPAPIVKSPESKGKVGNMRFRILPRRRRH